MANSDTYNKYCDICDTLVSCTFSPSFCPWCGKDLRGKPLVDFTDIEGRLELLNKMRGYPDKPGAIPWDWYYSKKNGRRELLEKFRTKEAIIIDNKGQTKLF